MGSMECGVWSGVMSECGVVSGEWGVGSGK